MSIPYSVIDQSGKILRGGSCSEMDLELQAGPGEHSLKIQSSDVEDVFKKEKDGTWKKHKKSALDIAKRKEELKIKEVPHDKQSANITNGQLESLMNRIEALETQLTEMNNK